MLELAGSTGLAGGGGDEIPVELAGEKEALDEAPKMGGADLAGDGGAPANPYGVGTLCGRCGGQKYGSYNRL